MDIYQLKRDIGLRVKAHRNKKKYSREQFCKLLGITYTDLFQIERGQRFPSFCELTYLIHKAKIEPNFLFSYVDKKNRKYSYIDYDILDLLCDEDRVIKQYIKNVLKELKKSENRIYCKVNSSHTPGSQNESY